MKITATALTLFIIICLSGSSVAQGVKKQGYIILNNGDTLRGWINYGNWEKNPSVIRFSGDSKNNDFSKYLKNNIQVVEITGLDRYIKTVVKKDVRPIDIDHLLPADIDSVVIDTVLLRVIVEGPVFSLYELVDEKPHFFVKTPTEGITELVYRIEKHGIRILTKKNYIGQLKLLANTVNPSLDFLKKIDNARYVESDLSAIAKEINKTAGNLVYTTPEANNKLKFSLLLGIGGGYNKLKVTGTETMLNNMKFDGSFMPFFVIGGEFASPRNLQGFSFGGEIGFSTAQYTGNGKIGTYDPNIYITKYTLKQTNISPALFASYSFIRKENFKIYAGGALAGNTAFYKKNIYTTDNNLQGHKEKEDYLDLPNWWMSLMLRLGAKISNRWGIELIHQFPADITHYAGWGITSETTSARIKYHF